LKLLLKYGADTAIKDKDGKTAVDLARANDHSEAAALLVKKIKFE
jgi:ankyrin repeat protein